MPRVTTFQDPPAPQQHMHTIPGISFLQHSYIFRKKKEKTEKGRRQQQAEKTPLTQNLRARLATPYNTGTKTERFQSKRNGAISVETAHGRGLGAVEIRLVSEQLPDVGDAVLDHRGPL